VNADSGKFGLAYLFITRPFHENLIAYLFKGTRYFLCLLAEVVRQER